jgi:NIPSNAP protein
MKTNCLMLGSALNRWKSKVWKVFGIALIALAVGSLMTAKLMGLRQVSADSNRVFELRVYHTVPGKVLDLEARFRDTTSKVLAKHDLKVVGYWVPEGAPAWENTFIFMVAHASREEAKKNWDAIFSDPEFQEVVKAEQANKLVEKVDVTYMRPTDFSPMK